MAQPFAPTIVISRVTVVPGWYSDPFASDHLRWWDGAWTTHTAVRNSHLASGAITLGIAGFVLIYFPIVSLLLSTSATLIAIASVRENRDDTFAVLVLSINTVVLSLRVVALAWSVWTGLYGIVISPAPA